MNLVVLVVLLHNTIHLAEAEAEVVQELYGQSISRLNLVCLLQPRNSLSVDKVNLSILSLVLIVGQASVVVELADSVVSLLDDEVASLDVAVELIWTKLSTLLERLDTLVVVLQSVVNTATAKPQVVVCWVVVE